MTSRHSALVHRSLGVVVIAATFVTGCSGDLTRKTADRVVSQNPKAAGIAPVATEGISKTSDSEAITKTRLGEDLYNLKFRRYDNDWKWEFVETKGGGWIAADELLDELQEKQRLKRAEAWAVGQLEAYTKTIAEMDEYSDNMPRRTDWSFDVMSWSRLRKSMADLLGSFKSSATPDKRAEIDESIKRLQSPAFDAWGNEILLHFNSSDRQATFVSLGPDKQKGSADDIICIVSGRRNWDNSRDEIMWDYSKAWRLPEGLQPAIDKAIEEKENRGATFTRVVQ